MGKKPKTEFDTYQAECVFRGKKHTMSASLLFDVKKWAKDAEKNSKVRCTIYERRKILK